jgi:hypothetical protein
MSQTIIKKQFAIVARVFNVPADLAYAFIAEPTNLPQWALAFKEADDYSARLSFPDGADMRVSMKTVKSKDFGIVDWHLSLPNDFVDVVRSRVYSISDNRCIYELSFNQRPVEESEMENAMEQQARLVEKEFDNLNKLLTGVER